MAYDQTRRIKQTMVTALADVVPDGVPVDYAWPGTNQQKETHVWFVGARTVSEPYAMRAGRKRRLQTTEFDVIIETHLKGPTLDGGGVNVLQARADELVESVAGVIDEWVADNVTLGQTASTDVPVDHGSVSSFTLSHGPVENGVTSIGVLTITYTLRPL